MDRYALKFKKSVNEHTLREVIAELKIAIDFD